MAGAAQVLIRVGAQVSDAVNEFQRLDRAVGDHLSKTEKVQSAVRKAAVPAGIALAAMGYAAIDATKAAAEDAEAQAKLAGTLDRVTNASDSAIAAADGYISSLSQQVGVADDELRPALGKLATATGDLTKAQQLLGTALDISAQTGKPLDAVTTALSKAYAGNEGALKRLLPGIDEGILKSGDFAKVQAELARLTGGAAAESANTAAGQFRRFQITLQETKEAIGAALLPIFNAFLPILQKVAKWAQENSDVLVILGGVIAGVAATIVGINAVMSVWNAISNVVRIATVALTAAQAALNVVLAANPIGIVVIALAAIAAAIYLAWQRSETFREAVYALWNNVLVPAGQFIGGVFSVYWQTLKTYIDAGKTAFDAVRTAVDAVWEAFKSLAGWMGDVFEGAWNALKAAINPVKTVISAVASGAESVWEAFKSVAEWINDKAGPVFNVLKKAIEVVAVPIAAIITGLSKILSLLGSIEGKGGNVFGPGGTVGRVGTGVVRITGGQRTQEIVIAPSAQQYVDEEAIARAIWSILSRSDARNGEAVYG